MEITAAWATRHQTIRPLFNFLESPYPHLHDVGSRGGGAIGIGNLFAIRVRMKVRVLGEQHAFGSVVSWLACHHGQNCGEMARRSGEYEEVPDRVLKSQPGTEVKGHAGRVKQSSDDEQRQSRWR